MEDLAFELVAAIDPGSVFTKILNVLSVALGLGLVIFFHELGHFAVAKWCDVHVERFSIGIGPILWSRQKGETEYALSALPFGGYVKMLGQDDMDPNQMTSSEIAENPRSYSSKSVPQRMAIISAGVVMNVVTGFLFFTICYWFGVNEPSPVVGSVVPGFPAWTAGMKAGDRIEAINGEEIRSFGDVFESVVLSTGDVRVEGKHLDGSRFDFVLTPDRGASGRSVGVQPNQTTTLSKEILNPEEIAITGLPAKRATLLSETEAVKSVGNTTAAAGSESPAPSDASVAPPTPFQPGDKLIALQSEPVNTFVDLHRLTAKFASQDLIYTFERTTKDGQPDVRGDTTQVRISVPPDNVRSVGLWMAMGPVRAIRAGSIAEAAGLKVGDIILSVDNMVMGSDYDPVRLPTYFSEHAGTEVLVKVSRQAAAAPEQHELKMVPTDEPGWTEIPIFQTSPLPIPAIGAAYQVFPNIAKVVPGSEAEKTGMFAKGQKVTKIELIKPPAPSDESTASNQETPALLKLNELEKKQPGTTEDINWAWAFSEIQQAPDHQIRVYLEDDKAILLSDIEKVPDWYRWTRGIRGWEPAVELQKGKSLGDATELGLRKTRKTGVNIYMTLRSLFRGDLPADSFSGPVGILSIGYRVASQGLTDLLLFLGFLSINLAILNFLPIPVLDGGHMVFLIWEGVTRRKPSPRVIGYAHAAGLLFIISLFMFVMYIDLFVNKFGSVFK
ncbi:MAG: site-2 protease family protein [Planctomycetaceae bacterium]|nr:site-2 protease family protein [Planctomycetaceae bacterium]